MGRHISYALLLVATLGSTVALAQTDPYWQTAAPNAQPAPQPASAYPPVTPQAVPPPAATYPPVAAQIAPQTATLPPYAQTAGPQVLAPAQASAPAPGAQVWQPVPQPSPLPGQPVYAQPLPPGQPVYVQPGPQPMMLVPMVPVWQAPPSPQLGLIPGDGSPRWDIAFESLWLERDSPCVRLGSTNYSFPPHPPHGMHADSLWTDDAESGLATGARVQLTARITDSMTIEATGWGLQQWSVGRTIYGDTDGQTVLGYSSWLPMSDMIGGFDNYLGYTYESRCPFGSRA